MSEYNHLYDDRAPRSRRHLCRAAPTARPESMEILVLAVVAGRDLIVVMMTNNDLPEDFSHSNYLI